MLDVLSAWEVSMNMTDMDSILLELPWLVGKEDIKQALQMRERDVKRHDFKVIWGHLAKHIIQYKKSR